MRRLRLLLIPVVLAVAGAGLVACEPNDVIVPSGGCGRQHAGWVTTEPNRIIYPFGLQEAAQVTIKGGWASSGYGAHCTGYRVGDPFLRPGTDCSGARYFPGFSVQAPTGCNAHSYEGSPWTVTWLRQSGTGYFWATGDSGFPGSQEVGVFNVYAMMKAHTHTAAMEHDCWITGDAPTNVDIYCRHQHEW